MSWRSLINHLRPQTAPQSTGTALARSNPIAILSFNRPHYLSQVLDSLLAQTALGDRAVLLFQDNAVSPFTG